MKKIRKYAISTILILTLISGLTGCASKNKDNSSNTTTNSATTAPAVTEAATEDTSDSADTNQSAEPKYGGEVNVAVLNEIDSLDPYVAVAAGTREVMFNVYEGLVKYDATGAVQPAVASDYTISDDSKTYTFTIRKGIKFHNGNEVTAEDVKFSLEKAKTVGTADALVNIDQITTDGDKVTIQLLEPDNDLLPFLTASFSAIIPNGYEDSATTPIGTGPFKFVSYEIQQNLVLEKFTDYWNADKVYLDKVTFKLFADADAAYLELLAGTIDIYPAVETNHYDELKDKYNIVLGYRNMVQLLALNNNVEPFNNAKVRKALNLAIDKDQIVEVLSNGYGTKIGSSVIPGFTKYYDETLADAYQVNIDEAKKLLNEAGYENGFEFTIRAPGNYAFHVQTAELIASQLEQIGVTAKIEQVEWGVWIDDVYTNRNYEATIIGLTGELSPRDWLGRYASTSPKNFINFSDPKYDEVYQKATKEIDDAASVSYYKELQKILSDDAASVFIQDTKFLNVLKSDLSGYQAYPLYVQDLSTVYYTK